MSEHVASIVWKRNEQVFIDNRYSRAHHWRFDGGIELLASPAPTVVRPPLSDPAGVDPEEAFVASLSSCHMLFFLTLAAKQKLLVDSYQDDAVGTLGKNAAGRYAMLRVVLRPQVMFAEGVVVSPEQIAALHHDSHEQCFIANSVTTEITVEPR